MVLCLFSVHSRILIKEDRASALKLAVFMNKKTEINRYIGLEPQEFKVVGYSVPNQERDSMQQKCKIKISHGDAALNIQQHLRWTPQLVV